MHIFGRRLRMQGLGDRDSLIGRIGNSGGMDVTIISVIIGVGKPITMISVLEGCAHAESADYPGTKRRYRA